MHNSARHQCIRRIALQSVALATLVASAPAIAQSDPAEPAQSDGFIPEIIVQARRVAENQQDIPVAVSTITAERLQNATISSTADIQRLVPSLQVTQNSSGYQDFIIRGSPAGFGNDPAVVTYFDEVPIEPRALVYSLFDLASVQQLKGPQGTLFGRNSTGGAVLFFSHRPDLNEVNGYVSGRFGNLGERRVEAAVNLPVNGTWALRVAGQLARRDALVTSIGDAAYGYGNRDNQAVRVSSLWKPTDTVEIYTQGTYYDQDQRHMPQIISGLAGPCTSLAQLPTNPICAYQAPFNSFFGVQDVRALFTQEQGLPSDQTINDHPNLDQAERYALTNSITVDLADVSIRNITYLGENELRFTKDFDGTPVRIFDSDHHDIQKSFYNELQLYGKLLDEKIDWRVGGLYDNERPYETSETWVLGQLLPGQPRNAEAIQRFKSYALFGQVTAEVIPSLRVTAGLRHTWDDRSLTFRIFQGPTQACGQQTNGVPFSGTDLATCTRNLKLKFDDTNYNLSIDWKPVDKVLLYATMRRGYKAGSFNLLSTRDDLTTYDPEIAEDIELGAKTDFRIGGMPIRLNVAAFRTNFKNFQASSVLVEANGNINVLTLNREPVTGTGNRAQVKGIEAELTVSPTTWLQLTGFFSEIEAKYKTFLLPSSRPGAQPTANLAGTDMAGVIPETIGVTGEIHGPLRGITNRASALVSFYTTATPLVNPLIPTISPRRESLDARIGFNGLFNSGFDFALFGKNLTDFNSCTQNSAVSGEPTCLYGEPRSYGVELTFRFGGSR